MSRDETAPATHVGAAAQHFSNKYSGSSNYLMLMANVMIVGFEPGHGTYVDVDFVSPPTGCPLGVSAVWDASGVELAKLAMAHGKRMNIVYRRTGFSWSDIVDLAVLNF